MFDKVRRGFREWRFANRNLNWHVVAEFHFISESGRLETAFNLCDLSGGPLCLGRSRNVRFLFIYTKYIRLLEKKYLREYK